MGELIFMLFLTIVGIAMFVMTNEFPVSIIDKSGGAALFPRIVIIILWCLVVIRTIQILMQKKEERESFAFLEIFKGSRLVYLVGTFLYFVLVTYVGFIITSIIYILGAVLYFHFLQFGKMPTRKKTIILSTSIVFGIVAMDYIFCVLMNVMLPSGILGF